MEIKIEWERVLIDDRQLVRLKEIRGVPTRSFLVANNVYKYPYVLQRGLNFHFYDAGVVKTYTLGSLINKTDLLILSNRMKECAESIDKQARSYQGIKDIWTGSREFLVSSDL